MAKASSRPKRSRFMSSDYSIKWVERDTLVVDGDTCHGATKHSRQSIEIELGQTHIQERDTVLHECLHQMFAASGLDLKPELEERIVGFLGGAVIHHLHENPSLWRYLAQKAPKDGLQE